MDMKYCKSFISDTMTAFLYGSLAMVSFYTAMHSRKMEDVVLADIVMVERVSLPITVADGL